MDKYYILIDEQKRYLDKVQDGFLLFDKSYNGETKIDLAKIKTVYEEDGDKVNQISIRQYLLVTDQLGQGNEWEVNKWIIYVIFCVASSLINGGFCLSGYLITLYTIPSLLIVLFCCIQLWKIGKKKIVFTMIIFQVVSFLLYPLMIFLSSNITFLHWIGETFYE